MSGPSFTLDAFADHWCAFCDADHGDYPADFIERVEKLGLASLVPVTPDDLDDAFAYERGIEAGGSMWQLTRAGHAAFRKSRGDAA